MREISGASGARSGKDSRVASSLEQPKHRRMSTEGSRVGTAAASGDGVVSTLPGTGGSVADRGSLARGNQAASGGGDIIRDNSGV